MGSIASLSALNVGDIVLCVVEGNPYISKGKQYKVVLVTYKEFSIIDDEGEEYVIIKENTNNFVKVYD